MKTNNILKGFFLFFLLSVMVNSAEYKNKTYGDSFQLVVDESPCILCPESPRYASTSGDYTGAVGVGINKCLSAIDATCTAATDNLPTDGGTYHFHNTRDNEYVSAIFTYGAGFSAFTIYDDPSADTPPTATNVTFTGTLQVGEILTGDYNYDDVESDAEASSTFKWYRSDDTSGTGKVEIAGATAKTYTLVSADEGKYISFEVTPANANGTGSAYESAINATEVIAAEVAPTPTPTPTPTPQSYTVGTTYVSAEGIVGATAVVDADGNNIVTASHAIDGVTYTATVVTNVAGETLAVITYVDPVTGETVTVSSENYPAGTSIQVMILNGQLVIRVNLQTNSQYIS